MRKTLLVSISTIALIAGAGLAGAQDKGGGQGGGGMQGGQPPAASPGGGGAMKGGESRGGESKGGETSAPQRGEQAPAQRAQDSAPKGEKKGDMKADTKSDKKGPAAAENPSDNKGSTASDSKSDKKGTAASDTKSDKKGSTASDTKRENTTGQGAAGARGSTNLTTEQRTKITTTIRQTNVRPVTNVNFRISIGTAVPRSITLNPLPATVIEVYPEWRPYRFILVGNDILVIDPDTYEIVAVLDA